MQTTHATPRALAPTAQALVKLTAKRPGVTAQEIQDFRLVGDLAPETVRLHLARLRHLGYLYTARPAWVLLKVHYAQALAATDEAQPMADAMRQIARKALEVGPCLQSEFVRRHRGQRSPTAVTALVVRMRAVGVLYDWHALVLTSQGIDAARELGASVKTQHACADEMPPATRG